MELNEMGQTIYTANAECVLILDELEDPASENVKNR